MKHFISGISIAMCFALLLLTYESTFAKELDQLSPDADETIAPITISDKQSTYVTVWTEGQSLYYRRETLGKPITSNQLVYSAIPGYDVTVFAADMNTFGQFAIGFYDENHNYVVRSYDAQGNFVAQKHMTPTTYTNLYPGSNSIREYTPQVAVSDGGAVYVAYQTSQYSAATFEMNIVKFSQLDFNVATESNIPHTYNHSQNNLFLSDFDANKQEGYLVGIESWDYQGLMIGNQRSGYIAYRLHPSGDALDGIPAPEPNTLIDLITHTSVPGGTSPYVELDEFTGFSLEFMPVSGDGFVLTYLDKNTYYNPIPSVGFYVYQPDVVYYVQQNMTTGLTGPNRVGYSLNHPSLILSEPPLVPYYYPGEPQDFATFSASLDINSNIQTAFFAHYGHGIRTGNIILYDITLRDEQVVLSPIPQNLSELCNASLSPCIQNIACHIEHPGPGEHVANYLSTFSYNSAVGITHIPPAVYLFEDLNGESYIKNNISGITANIDEALIIETAITIENSHLSFTNKGRIHVMNGGTLTLVNTTLSGIESSCNGQGNMWMGIDVDKGGKLIATGNTNVRNEIRNAIMGVKNFSFDFYDGTIHNQGGSGHGGKLEIEYTDFIDCYEGVVLKIDNGPTPGGSGSFVKHCNFTTNNPMADIAKFHDNGFHNRHIYVDRVPDVEVRNCNFVNNSSMDYKDMASNNAPGDIKLAGTVFSVAGIGISAVHSDIVIRDCNFENLSFAVELSDYNTARSSGRLGIVRDCVFDDNECAVRLIGGSDANVIENDITGTDHRCFGIQVHGTLNYDIMGNRIRFLGATSGNIGISSSNYPRNVANSSLIETNELENWGTNFAGMFDNTWTQLKCNDFEDGSNTVNHWYHGTALDDQGFCFGPDPTTPAGNRFLGSPPSKGDIYIEPVLFSNHITSFEYYHHDAGGGFTLQDFRPSVFNNGTQGVLIPRLNCNFPFPGFGEYAACEAGTAFKTVTGPLEPFEDIFGGGGNVSEKKQQEWTVEMIDYLIVQGLEANIIPLLESISVPFAKWMLIPEYIGDARYTDAQNLINVLPTGSNEQEASRQYYQFLVTFLNNGGSFDEMEDSDIGALQTLAGTEFGAAQDAKTLLYLYSGEFIPMETVTYASSKTTGFEDVTESLDDRYKVYPNPADHTISITSPEAQEGMIYLMDMMGRIVQQIDISAESTRHQIDVSGVSNGMYQLMLFNDSGTSHLGKVIITH